MRTIHSVANFTTRCLGIAATGALLAGCSSSTPVEPDTRAPFVGWLVPSMSTGDTLFVFTEDTTTVMLNAGDDGGVISNVKVFVDGVTVATLTSAPYQTVLSLAGIPNNRSARIWATAADPTGKVGSTEDTLRFVHSATPDTATWLQLSPTRSPEARDGFTWETDPVSAKAYLFGGYTSATFASLGDLWSFDLVTNQWDSLSPSGSAPDTRTRHGAGLASGRMVVFGGEHFDSLADSLLEDYRVLDIATLTWGSGPFNFALRPTQAMSTGTLGSKVYFFGGVDALGQAHDSLRSYDLLTDQWQSLVQANLLPGPRALALVAANSGDQEMFLYGGTAGGLTGLPAGTSNYRLNVSTLTWISTAAPGPPALADGGAVYDSTLHRILIWGGRDASGSYPVEVWEFALGAHAWRQVPIMGTPPAGRSGHRLIFDAPRNRVLLFGGSVGGSWNNETWQLSW